MDHTYSVQVKAHPVLGSGEKAKDPIFGLTMGVSSQAPSDVFRYMRNIYVTSVLSRLLKFWNPKLLGGVCDLLFKQLQRKKPMVSSPSMR